MRIIKRVVPPLCQGTSSGKIYQSVNQYSFIWCRGYVTTVKTQLL